MSAVRWRRSEDYGWSLSVGRRLRWNSTKATWRMWPRVRRGADENCNLAITFVLWPLGSLDVWWHRGWRTAADGPCEECRAIFRGEGLCEWCACQPCNCSQRPALVGDGQPKEQQ